MAPVARGVLLLHRKGAHKCWLSRSPYQHTESALGALSKSPGWLSHSSHTHCSAYVSHISAPSHTGGTPSWCALNQPHPSLVHPQHGTPSPSVQYNNRGSFFADALSHLSHTRGLPGSSQMPPPLLFRPRPHSTCADRVMAPKSRTMSYVYMQAMPVSAIFSRQAIQEASLQTLAKSVGSTSLVLDTFACGLS